MAINALLPLDSPSLDDVLGRVERALLDATDRCAPAGAPPRLRAAVKHAVLGSGGRLRPTLVLAAAASLGDPRPHLSDAMAAAVELVHAASLVHDDLPCFDDADTRRGQPTVHRLWGEATAVLVGDALIVHAFETLARAGEAACAVELAKATGAARGIIAGQAWEEEPNASLVEYHRAKTASLFAAAAAMGAIAGGGDTTRFRAWGETVGLAYQAADDLVDALGAESSGKTGGRDEALDRPSVVRAFGVEAARRRVRTLLERASDDMPDVRDPAPLRAWLARFSDKVESL